MEETAARQLVEETLQGSFDRDRFVYLTKNLLNHAKEDPYTYRGAKIFDAFADSISEVERIGEYIGPDEKVVDILIVHLKKETSLERARTKQRNFVAKYLKGGRGGVLRDAALVAFVAPNGEDWRFSLVRMEYAFTEEGKVQEEFTPARRYSFLVGQNENSHTAQSRLFPLLLDDKTHPSLDQLEEVFSVERVTKEFFEQYRELFLRFTEELDRVVENDTKLRTDFEKKGVDTVDFAKKLLGQIVFLYFLQKKGWFGVQRGEDWGSGSTRFLRELFDRKHGDYSNFFNDVLEPLFYEALRLDRPGDYYAHFDCRIPFLDGGLFDPLRDYDWWDTDILLPNSIFSNDRKTTAGDVGDGLLDVFDRFNFTVKEDEPLEKEVAVDPEMLGKVFENLLEVKDRKSKGTYYTPREIVHYMCQESLANYLSTQLASEVTSEDVDTLIAYGETAVEHDSRVVDEGRETTAYAFKLPKSVRKHAEQLDEALAAIRVCDPAVGSGAFPVAMMHEIVRARNALTPYLNGRAGRSPYEFKRHAIQNCLYGVDIDRGAVEIAKLRLWLSLVVDEEERDTIHPLPNLDYKIVVGNSLFGYPYQPRGLDSIERLQDRLVEETRPSEKDALRTQIQERIDSLLGNTVDNLGYPVTFDFTIFFPEVFRGAKGFDVVIANPPYVSAWSMTKQDAADRERIKNALARYPFLVGHWDLYVAFVAKGHQLLAPGGNLAYIVPNPILKEKYASALRQYLLENTTLTSVLAFSDVNVFDNVARRTTVLVALKTRPTADYEIPICTNDSGIIRCTNEVTRDSWAQNPRSVFLLSSDAAETALLDKIEQRAARIGNYCYVNYGAQVSSKKKGGFGKRDVVSTTPVGNAKLFFEGKDVRRWHIRDRELWLDYRMTEMYGCRAPELFEADKIVVRKVSDRGHRPAAALDTSGRYTDDGNVLVVPYSAVAGTPLRSSFSGYEIAGATLDLRYVLAMVVSRLQAFYFMRRFATESLQGATSHTYPTTVRALPILELSKEKQQPIIDLVDEIRALAGAEGFAASESRQAKVGECERRIDQLVYEHYGLNKEEVELIKAAVK